MRYRIMDVLICPDCGQRLLLRANKVSEETFPADAATGFTCKDYCGRFDRVFDAGQKQECERCCRFNILEGLLTCDKCGSAYGIVAGVPDFTGSQYADKDSGKAAAVMATDMTYSLLWHGVENKDDIVRYHYDYMQEVIPEKIVEGRCGLEIGCGSGIDTRIMAARHPSTEIVAIDISEGVYTAVRFSKGLKNVHIIRSSSLKLPFRDRAFDYCYSFGVIHHTPDPARCFDEAYRVLRRGGKTFLYLYEDHADNMWKRYPIKIVTAIRKVSSRIDKRLLYLLSVLASPVVFLSFTVPAKILQRFDKTRKLADHIPFNFGTGPFSLRGDIYDRFGAPIELRFNKGTLGDMLARSGFTGMRYTRLKTSAGLVSWAQK